MKYSEIEQLLKFGKIGLLPNYKGYFKWDYGLNKPYMLNDNYVTYNLDSEKQRTDWYYII